MVLHIYILLFAMALYHQLTKGAWFFQSTEKPRPNPPTASTGGAIEVESLNPCPYGTSCYRKRWWVKAYDQGGDINTECHGKPAKHYHLKLGARWIH